VSRVYASLPLTGPTAGAGRDVLRGAQLALEAANGTAPELVVLDGFGADRDGQAIANARRAAQDEEALASVLARYCVDADGHTTSTAYGRLAVVDGALAWDVAGLQPR
jgi:ABC-type branched-subunit amino acid transport system substrate-binding protein